MSTPEATQSTATSATPNSTTIPVASTPITSTTDKTVSPGKLPMPPPSLPVSPISPAPSGPSGCPTTRSDSISFGSLLGPDNSSVDRAALAVSMTNIAEKTEAAEAEDVHEIHCDHLSVHSQTSGTASYLTVNPMFDIVGYYSRKKKPKQIIPAKLTHYGDVTFAKHVVLHPHNAQPLRCKVNSKLLKTLNMRQKAIRKANQRGHRYFKITAIRMLPREASTPRPVGNREMGVGYVEAHVAALTEFIASPLSAHSRLLIRTKFDQATVVNVDIDVIDERAGSREEEDDAEARVPDAQVKADYYATLERPPARSTESLANVLTDCEASTMMKAHDVSTAKPISARPSGGLFSRMFNKLTFGVFG